MSAQQNRYEPLHPLHSQQIRFYAEILVIFGAAQPDRNDICYLTCALICYRVFVGNLNTFQIVKTDVEKIFQKYGRIAGISMHKVRQYLRYSRNMGVLPAYPCTR